MRETSLSKHGIEFNVHSKLNEIYDNIKIKYMGKLIENSAWTPY